MINIISNKYFLDFIIYYSFEILFYILYIYIYVYLCMYVFIYVICYLFHTVKSYVMIISFIDVDEHFRRSLNGFYKRRRRSEQLRRRGNLLSPPPQVQIPSQNTSIVVSCPPQPGSRIRRTWAPETTPTTPPPPPPYSAYKTSTPTSSAISSSSSFAGTYKKTGRRRASCIPDLPRHRVVRPDSPELPSCVVSLSESAAVSVSGECLSFDLYAIMFKLLIAVR